MFLMEMFVLSYGNVPWQMFTPDSVFKSVPHKGSELTWQTSMLYLDTVLLIYVNETIFALEFAFLQNGST